MHFTVCCAKIIKLSMRRYAAVAQLDRVTGYEPVGRGFESLQPYHKETPVTSTVTGVSFFSKRPWFFEPGTHKSTHSFLHLKYFFECFLRKTGCLFQIAGHHMTIHSFSVHVPAVAHGELLQPGGHFFIHRDIGGPVVQGRGPLSSWAGTCSRVTRRANKLEAVSFNRKYRSPNLQRSRFIVPYEAVQHYERRGFCSE